MIYKITFCWASARYHKDYPPYRPSPASRFHRLREDRLRNGVVLPLLNDWSFAVDCEDVSEHQMTAEASSMLPNGEFKSLLIRELVPEFADRVRIRACPDRFARIASLN